MTLRDFDNEQLSSIDLRCTQVTKTYISLVIQNVAQVWFQILHLLCAQMAKCELSHLTN